MSVRATAERTDSRKQLFFPNSFSAFQGHVLSVLNDRILESCQFCSFFRFWKLKGGNQKPQISEFLRIFKDLANQLARHTPFSTVSTPGQEIAFPCDRGCRVCPGPTVGE